MKSRSFSLNSGWFRRGSTAFAIGRIGIIFILKNSETGFVERFVTTVKKKDEPCPSPSLEHPTHPPSDFDNL